MINHYDLSRILGSEIVGKVDVGHGQIEASRTLTSVADASSHGETAPTEAVDWKSVCEIFLKVRGAKGDRGSPDLYIADRERNEELLKAWRAHNLAGTDGALNRCLMNARKANRLPDLNSKRFVISKERKEKLRFVCELVATQLRYERGVSVDDIICIPKFAVLFDKRCRSHVPGYEWLEYRWTILSIRKSGRHNKPAKSHAPLDLDAVPFSFTDEIELKDVSKSARHIPSKPGVFALVEGRRDLYVAGTEQLRASVEYHSQPNIVSAINGPFWHPANPLKFRFAKVDKPYITQVENWLISNRHPVFNVPRTAA